MMNNLRLLSVLVVGACAQNTSAPIVASNTPEEVVSEFLTALDHLDLERIMATQTEDATMFFPHSYATYRLDGITRIADEMGKAFEMARQVAEAAGRTSPPYLGVVENASNRKLQMIGDRGAVVSWVVDRPGNFGRRTATLRLDDDGVWRMVNFHSSNLLSNTAGAG